MTHFRRLIAAVGASTALVLATVSGVFAADYSSQVTAAGADLVSDVTPALAAAVVISLGVIALFIGARLAIRAFKLARG